MPVMYYFMMGAGGRWARMTVLHRETIGFLKRMHSLPPIILENFQSVRNVPFWRRVLYM